MYGKPYTIYFQQKWVAILSQEYPTMAFHASITNPFGKGALINLLRQFSQVGCLQIKMILPGKKFIKQIILTGSLDVQVFSWTLKLKHNYNKFSCIVLQLHTDKKQISVGFIGYPNVGKSSIINSLRAKKVCKVAPIAGETKVCSTSTKLLVVMFSNYEYIFYRSVVKGQMWRTLRVGS